MPQHIVVTEYSFDWTAKFDEESKIIKNILKDNCIAIHHIGSTAVTGLKAKPIIDIMPVVINIQKVDALASEFNDFTYDIEAYCSGKETFMKKLDKKPFYGQKKMHHAMTFSCARCVEDRFFR